MSPSRTVHAFYTFVALRWLRLTGALWILYLLHVGWFLWQVGVAEAVFHVVSFSSGIPTGIFADRFGRRHSLLLGLLIGAVATPLEYLAAPHGVLPGALAMGFSALGWTFIGGADQALLHDLSRNLPDGPQGFARLYGGMDAISLASGAVAAPLGGWLAISFGWGFPYFGQAFLTALAAMPVLLLPGPRFAGLQAAAGEARPGLLAAWTALKSQKGLASLVVFGAALGIVATSQHLYGQSTLTAKGLTVVQATAVIGLSSLLAAAASALAYRARRPGPTRLIRGGALLFSLLVASVGPARGLGAPVAYALADATEGGVDVLYATQLNRAAPEGIRATIASAPETLFSLGMIVLFPVEGWAMGRLGLDPVYFGLALLLLAAATLPFGGRRAAPRHGAVFRFGSKS